MLNKKFNILHGYQSVINWTQILFDVNFPDDPTWRPTIAKFNGFWPVLAPWPFLSRWGSRIDCLPFILSIGWWWWMEVCIGHVVQWSTQKKRRTWKEAGRESVFECSEKTWAFYFIHLPDKRLPPAPTRLCKSRKYWNRDTHFIVSNMEGKAGASTLAFMSCAQKQAKTWSRK